MQSTALYMGDLPNWTLQVKGHWEPDKKAFKS